MVPEYLLTGLAIGLTVDFLMNDPPNSYHPVAWLGKLIEFFIPKLKNGNRSARKEKLKGIVFATGLVVIFVLAIHLTLSASLRVFEGLILILGSALFLNVAVSVKGMEKHIDEIVFELRVNNLKHARQKLSMIVRRDTVQLDEPHILSAMIECIGESTVDGIVSPLFYFTFFGPVGAFAYRIINTLDSMIGYPDKYYRDIGWMSAKLDTFANCIPSRITAILIVFSAKIIGADWRNSLRILERDHDNTLSYNAGYPMASMAGALRIRLEKIGQYSLGDEFEPATVDKCMTALVLMKLATILFCIIISSPIIIVLSLTGWWDIVFGL
ncbi:MAG: cobalamin biosynthesis protein [Thermoproteota archaeon]|nr:cobalamin biosynthesis protein [Thermoproteota archaeon]